MTSLPSWQPTAGIHSDPPLMMMVPCELFWNRHQSSQYQIFYGRSQNVPYNSFIIDSTSCWKIPWVTWLSLSSCFIFRGSGYLTVCELVFLDEENLDGKNLDYLIILPGTVSAGPAARRRCSQLTTCRWSLCNAWRPGGSPGLCSTGWQPPASCALPGQAPPLWN